MLGLVTYTLILVALMIGAWRRSTVAVAAVLVLYGLKQWGQSSTLLLSDYRQFTNFAVFAIALLAVLNASRKRSCVFCQIAPTSWLILTLYLYALLSLLWAPDMNKSFEQWTIEGPYVITITLIAPLLMSDLQDARIAFRWTAAAGGALCMLALVFGNWGNRGLLLYGDINESETNPLALSSLAGTVYLIAALSLGRSNRIVVRVFSACSIPIALAVILKSGSRGQLISSAAATFVALPIAFRIRDLRSIAGLILAAAVVLGLGSWGASLVTIDLARWQGSDPQSAVLGRFDNAQRLLEASTSNVATTVFGLGNSSSFQVIGSYPHISGLEILAEEGLVGAAVYFTILALAIRSIIRIARVPTLTDATRGALAMLAGLFTFELILSWKQGTLLSSVYVFFYAIGLSRMENSTAAVAASTDRGRTPQTTPIPRFPNLVQ